MRLFSVLAFTVGAVPLAAAVCEKFDSNMGATFDVSDLMRASNEFSYMITDGDIPCTTAKEKNFSYVFNVCAPVSRGVPDSCLKLATISSAALQVNLNNLDEKDDDWCYSVGEYKEGTSQLKLLDSENPTKGVKLTYYGAPCSNGKQRQFVVEMPCADRLNPNPTSALELEHCVYTVEMPSVYGCPLECPVAERKLCGGNGHCHYDYDSNSAHCFCNRGYSGSNCMQSTESEGLNYSPVLMGLIITLFIIIALLGAGLALMIRQVNAYREDVANYQALKGEDDTETRGV